MLGEAFNYLLPRFRTYPGLLPLLHLDHMYFDSALKIERLRLYKSRLP